MTTLGDAALVLMAVALATMGIVIVFLSRRPVSVVSTSGNVDDKDMVNTLTRSLLAVGSMGILAYTTATGSELNETVKAVTLIAVGWFFGNQTAASANRAVTRAVNELRARLGRPDDGKAAG